MCNKMKRLLSVFCIVSGMLSLVACGSGVSEQVIITEDNITKETIVIEGLTREYDLLFLTDTHMVVSSSKDSEQVAANIAERAPQFVDSDGVSSASQFAAWMDYANEQQVDAVLMGGDIIDFPSEGALEHLRKNLENLTMPYIYTLGNHDWTYPWEYMTEKGKQEYLPLFEPLMQGNTAIASLDMGEFVVVTVDNSAGQVNAAAMEEYRRILAQGKPVIVLVHVPFLTQSVLSNAREQWSSPVVIGGGNYGGIYPNDTSAAFVDMTTAADSPVELVLAGHVHFYDKDYMSGEKDVLQLVGDGGYKRQGMLLHISGSGE